MSFLLLKLSQLQKRSGTAEEKYEDMKGASRLLHSAYHVQLKPKIAAKTVIPGF